MKIHFILCSFCLLIVSSLSFSQESETKIGLGVSLNPTALFNSSSSSTMFLPIGFTNIYVPITINQSFRIEPEVGIFSQSSETSSGLSSSKYSSTLLRIGVGLFKIQPFEETFHSYVGPRIGILSTSSSSSSTGSTESSSSEMDYFVGLSVGGEYLFSTHFGIGGEVQLNYVSFGQPDRTPAASSSSDRKQSIITNNALMFFRWYY
jgi:hypothetical protein